MKSKIDIAKETAEKVHGSQTDKKNFPYMAHVNDVAKRVQQLGDDYFEDYLPRVKKNNIAKEVKIADSSHNLSKAHLLDNEPELQAKLRKKYIKVLNELGVNGPSCEKPIIFKDGEWVEK